MPNDMPGSAAATASPSLALVKYWGKADTRRNIPATPSLAMTLGGLTTRTEVTVEQADASRDLVTIHGTSQPEDRFAGFFAEVRDFARQKDVDLGNAAFRAASVSDFPSSAGLASSASGFAALTVACLAAAGIEASPEEISALARVGSASAARSVWGGFVRLDAGAETAEPVHGAEWWPDLRVLVVQTESRSKAVGSRDAMELTRRTSPYYESWLKDSRVTMASALEALESRDLDTLGPIMRSSYLRMFGTMFAASPPVFYWNSGSVEAITRCEQMRRDGLSAWETMDAGPQVKIFCTEGQLADIADRLADIPGVVTRTARPGAAAGIATP